MNVLRNTYFRKFISLFLVINILGDLAFPTAAWALTSGPTQPEFEGFTPVETSEMVNTFTGDFNYNIPLMDVGGYPINIAYTAGGTMDEEASWVGFGWTLNPGSMQRTLRGLPDDFAGDIISRDLSFKPITEFELTYKRKYEVIGYDFKKGKYIRDPEASATNLGAGLTYNNYTGYGFKMAGNYKGFELSSSSDNGVGLDFSKKFGVNMGSSYSFLNHLSTAKFLNLTPGLGYNSRSGLTQLTISGNKETKTKKIFGKYKSVGDKSQNYGYSYSFVTPQYSPTINYPMFNASGSIELNFGKESTANFWANSFQAHFQTQGLRKKAKSQSIHSYGYLKSNDANSTDESLHDFTREKDGNFATYVPHLPITSVTFDVFNFTAQGFGGNFRAKKNSIFMARDRANKNLGGGIDIGGIDFGYGSDFKFGLNIKLSQNNDKSGVWDDAISNMAFQSFNSQINAVNPLLWSILNAPPSNLQGSPYKDETYFKMSGELIPESDIDFFNDFGAFEPTQVKLKNLFFTTIAQDKIRINTGEEKTTPSIKRAKRERRNQHIAYLNGSDASNFGFQKEIENYSGSLVDIDNHKFSGVSNISRNNYPGHHISEFLITKDDGTKYYYGIPLYNNKQIESTFSVNQRTAHSRSNCSPTWTEWTCNHSNAETGYDKDVRYTDYMLSDDSKENENGVDNFYEKTTTPPYAGAYLLTAIISPDYIDITGDGPTDDDYGTYVKFNYQKHAQNYGWRAPYFGANYNSGLRSLTGTFGDDKASYTYGEKEIWYLHSIETKTHIAEFKLDDINRLDGIGAIQDQLTCPHDQSGLLSNSKYVRLKRLSTIKLYSKLDLFYNTNPLLLKTIKFTYNYSLCKGILNNENSYICNEQSKQISGKLTLTGIQITNGSSLLGELSSYNFDYAQKRVTGTETYQPDANLNPDFDLNSYDRWGNFKKKTHDASNAYDPYCIQNNRALADEYASAWNLSTIHLPSGGKIHVDYESDDYAYVQNKKVMQMMKMVGCSKVQPSSGTPLNNYLYDNTGIYEYLVFELPKQVSSNDEFKHEFLLDENFNALTSIYFKFLIKIDKDNDNSFEYVPGYLKSPEHFEITGNNFGEYDQSGKQYGYIKIKCLPIQDVTIKDCNWSDKGGANPISQVAWNFTKYNLPKIAYNQPEPTDNGVFQILSSMATSLVQFKDIFTSFNATMRSREMAKSFKFESSFLRFFAGNSKVGGGYRVKRIVFDDTWAGNDDDGPLVYGQEYTYTTVDERNHKVISSGVASYEPLLGGEENPWRQPIFTEEKFYLSPNVEHIMEEPLGESYFPSAIVGYSKVCIKNINYSRENLKRNNVGKMEYGFYTAKDYPVLPKVTPLDAKRNRPPYSLSPLKFFKTDIMTASEGFCIETNNMHGILAYEKIYSYNDEVNPISSKEYFYKTENGFQKGVANRLSNTVKIINSKGNIRDGVIGIESDLVSDFRERENKIRSFEANVDIDVVSSIAAFLPSLYAGLILETVAFRSAVLTKSVQRSGILDSIVVRDLSSSISTQNLLYDEESGQVLLTSTKNEYEDPVFNFNYPAYWIYPTLGSVAINHDIKVSTNDAKLYPFNFFNQGDKVLLTHPNGSWEIGWVSRLNPLSITDQVGDYYSLSDYSLIRVIESGNKNAKGVMAGAVASLANPIVGDGLQFNDVINSTATQFSDKWKIDCNCGYLAGASLNPFKKGSKGFYRPYKSFTYLTSRTQTRINKNLNIRRDGILTGFEPFWTVKSNGVWVPSTAVNWVSTGEITNYNPNGLELENLNPLGIYSGAVFGYGYKLPIIIGNNTRYREIGFESFEDYGYPGCKDRHFTFEEVISELTDIVRNQKHAHTGKFSLKISGSNSVSLKKVIENCN